MVRGFLGLIILTVSVRAEDWPQWMGPNRDGVWKEKNILTGFPKAGLKPEWTVKIAGGYAGPAVAAGKVVVADFVRKEGKLDNNPSERNTLKGSERIFCFDIATGKELWKYEQETTLKVSYAYGPRCTPTIHADKVYALGTMGHLQCLNLQTGKLIWENHLPSTYKCDVPIWGYSGHPLIYGNLLYTAAGGDGSAIVALNKDTGKEVWKQLTVKDIGYCPPTMIDHHGHPVLLFWHATELVAMRPQTGEKLWSVKLAPRYGMSICAPQQHGDLLFAAGMGTALTLRLKPNDAPEEVWRYHTKEFAVYPSISSPLIAEKTIFGCDAASGHLCGVDLATGVRLWHSEFPTTGKPDNTPHGSAFIVRNGEHYYLFNETGHLIVAKLDHKKYTEIDRVKLIEPTAEAFARKVVWSHPAYANQCIFVRNDEEIRCFSLAK